MYYDQPFTVYQFTLFTLSKYWKNQGQSWAILFLLSELLHQQNLSFLIFFTNMQPTKGQTKPRPRFPFFIYFQLFLGKIVNLTRCQKQLGHSFFQQSVKNVCAIKVDLFSRFRIGARQVFTIQKPLHTEIPLSMKTATSNSI